MSSRFTAIYDSLPQDAQQSLVKQHLIPLIGSVHKRKTRIIVGAASRLQKQHAGIPKLDLRSKKLEVNNMLRELSKDTKRSYVMDASNRAELLTEIVESVAAWLNDIWSVVYEHKVNFARAHDCLLFVSATLEKLDTIRMGCKCALHTMYVPVILRNSNGKTVKKFEVNGASRLEDVTLFIWRDMFLCMLCNSGRRGRIAISDMLGDIENVMGWKALVRMLYSRPKEPRHKPTADTESDWEDVWDGDEDSLPDLAGESGSDEAEFEEDNAEDEEPYVLDLPYMRHWSPSIVANLTRLQHQVEAVLVSVFETSPSSTLYDSLLSMSNMRLRTRLLDSLKAMATASPDTYSVALEIYSVEHELESVVNLLNSHSHLLRPRDFQSLQTATLFISSHGHANRALRILETELVDTTRAIRHALLQTFSQMESPANREELTQIIKMRTGAPGRRGRVEGWVDSATTPGADQPNPMMLAAMVMGIGPMAGLGPDDDPYTYLDLDPNDPDLAELRSEYRPELKKRFEGWADLGLVMKAGPTSLLGLYRKIIEILPILRAPDVTDEMISRLQDRASKQFVCDGLDALLAFVKVQRRKWNMIKQEQKRKEAQAAEANAAANRNIASSSSSAILPSTPRHTASPPIAGPSRLSNSPIQRPKSPGPPPLEPIAPYASGMGGATTQQPAQGVEITAPADLLAEIDDILTNAPAPPAVHTPMTLLNYFMGLGPPPAPPAPPANQGSTVDDID